jgi:transcriptional regulator with XRE-family HTH domain
MKLELKSLRKKRSLTQEELARLCEDWLIVANSKTRCSTQKISRLEQDKFEYLERHLIDALCAVLYCKIGDLIKVERV